LAYGIAKFYYPKSGAFDIELTSFGEGRLVETSTGATGALHFGLVSSGSALVPSPASFRLRAIPDQDWSVGAVTLTAGDGYVTSKNVDGNGEFILYYTDLAPGYNTIETVFVKNDGSINLSMESSSFVYDGRPHRAAISGIIPGDEVAYMYRVGDSGFVASTDNPSFIDVNGVISNSFAGGVRGEEILVYVIVTRGAVTERNSAIFTITPRPITVKPVDLEKKYDGAPLIPNRAEVSAGTLVDGHSLETSQAVFGGSRTGAGSSASSVRGVSVTGTNPDNYAITYAPGTLTVTELVEDYEDDDGDGDGEAGNGAKRGDGGGGNDAGDVSGGDSGQPATGTGDANGEDGAGDDSGREPVDEDAAPDGTDAGSDEKDIDESPTPSTNLDRDRGDESVASWLSHRWLLIAAAAAAIAIWAIASLYRRRGSEHEDMNENYKR
jgi:hypothetical protein